MELNRHWAYSLLTRMKFVQRKATTAKSKVTGANFTELKMSFLIDVVATVTMEKIPSELILNWDQALSLCHARHGQWINAVQNE